jgi:uncharacterized protein
MDGGIDKVQQDLESVYRQRADEVPFHGWTHIRFVVEKSLLAAEDLGADSELVALAAYVHDLNYLKGGSRELSSGQPLRSQILKQAGYDMKSISIIEKIVRDASTSNRDAHISIEAQALSDGDTAFKSLPTTPLLTPLFLQETGTSLRHLATQIVAEQESLSEQGIYFYSSRISERYGVWAKQNVSYWRRVLDSLDDPLAELATRDLDELISRQAR